MLDVVKVPQSLVKQLGREILNVFQRYLHLLNLTPQSYPGQQMDHSRVGEALLLALFAVGSTRRSCGMRFRRLQKAVPLVANAKRLARDGLPLLH